MGLHYWVPKILVDARSLSPVQSPPTSLRNWTFAFVVHSQCIEACRGADTVGAADVGVVAVVTFGVDLGQVRGCLGYST